MGRLVERFAPSPTGLLHLGHAFSALTVWEAARSAGGVFLLRVDDLDPGRCRPVYVDAIVADLRWLGLSWPEPMLFQSSRVAAHLRAIDALFMQGLAYPCFCTRSEIQAAASAPQEGAEMGPPYPGTCRHARRSPVGVPHALRLDMRAAIDRLGGPGSVRALGFKEIGHGPRGEQGRIGIDPDALINEIGDIVLRRKDGAIAYHMAVVLDDAWQEVSHVTRANDLFPSTPLHRLLQELTGKPTPTYRHHRLIQDGNGRRLAKRDGDMSLAAMRTAGATPGRIRDMIGL